MDSALESAVLEFIKGDPKPKVTDNCRMPATSLVKLNVYDSSSRSKKNSRMKIMTMLMVM